MHLLSALLSEGSLIDLDGTFFIQMGLFFVAFLILRSLVFGPVVSLIEKREEMIEGARVTAKELQKEAASTEDELAAQMRQARLKAGEERDRLRAEGKRLEAQVIEKVRTETSRELAQAEATLEKEAAKVRAEMQAQTPVLAKQIASKLLEREVA
jgi:F-type H+-transporting ATPase subunit b